MGYSVGGTFDSPLDFTVSCNADGSLTGLDTCDLEAGPQLDCSSTSLLRVVLHRLFPVVLGVQMH
eukprot:9327942-Alexandrium_andersonii.AAC.1